jgi:hypothetical protein
MGHERRLKANQDEKERPGHGKTEVPKGEPQDQEVDGDPAPYPLQAHSENIGEKWRLLKR